MVSSTSDVGSLPGVMSAAAKRHPTSACRRKRVSYCGWMMPSADSGAMTTGNSKIAPKARHMEMTKVM